MLNYGRSDGWREPGEWVGREDERRKIREGGREALITDFFGGVVEVDVEDSDTAREEAATTPDSDYTSNAGASRKKSDGHDDCVHPTRLAGRVDLKDSWSGIRAWGSFVLMGVVVSAVWLRA